MRLLQFYSLLNLMLFYCSIVYSNTPGIDRHEISALLQQRNDLIKTIQFEANDYRHGFKEGLTVFHSKVFSEDTNSHIKYVRGYKGDKVFDREFKQINDEVCLTDTRVWNGSIAKAYDTISKTGNVRGEPFSLNSLFDDNIALRIFDKYLYEFVMDESTRLRRDVNGIVAEVIYKGTLHRYLLDPDNGYLPKKYEIVAFRLNEVMKKVVVKEFGKQVVSGVDVYYVRELEKTLYTIHKNSQMIPLQEHRTVFSNVKFNQPIPDEEFDIQFPPDADIHDEFLGYNVPRGDETSLNSIQSIENEISEMAGRKSLISDGGYLGDGKEACDVHEMKDSKPQKNKSTHEEKTWVTKNAVVAFILFTVVILLVLFVVLRYVRSVTAEGN